VDIRKANKNDIDVAWQIRRESIMAECAEHYSPEIMDLWLNGELPADFSTELESNFYIAVVNEEIAGLGALSYKDNKIYAIFVKPEFLGKGVGKKMMIFLEGLAIQKGVNTVYLDSTLNAAPFYRSRGYIGDAVIKYNNPRGFIMDCIAMEKCLSTF
jgi:GNAT superfamily N-acetyltransferase